MKKILVTVALGGAVLTMSACMKKETAAENAAATVADANAADMAMDANAMGMANEVSAEPIDNAANMADAMSNAAGDKNNGDRENNGDRNNGDRNNGDR